MLRCRTTKELVTCLVGGGKEKKGERDYATDEKEKEEAVHIGRRRGGDGIRRNEPEVWVFRGGGPKPIFKKKFATNEQKKKPVPGKNEWKERRRRSMSGRRREQKKK